MKPQRSTKKAQRVLLVQDDDDNDTSSDKPTERLDGDDNTDMVEDEDKDKNANVDSDPETNANADSDPTPPPSSSPCFPYQAQLSDAFKFVIKLVIGQARHPSVLHPIYIKAETKTKTITNHGQGTDTAPGEDSSFIQHSRTFTSTLN